LSAPFWNVLVGTLLGVNLKLTVELVAYAIPATANAPTVARVSTAAIRLLLRI
jgi:hypothetical protein